MKKGTTFLQLAVPPCFIFLPSADVLQGELLSPRAVSIQINKTRTKLGLSFEQC